MFKVNQLSGASTQGFNYSQTTMNTNSSVLNSGTFSPAGGTSDQFTISMWIQCDSGAENRYFFSLGTGATAADPRLTLEWNLTANPGNIRIYLGFTSFNDIYTNVSNPASITKDNLNHFLLSRNGTTLQFYVNDAAISTAGAPTSGTQNFAALSEVTVGGGSGLNTFDGVLGDVWLLTGTALDLSVEANRRRFIDGAGAPVWLGTDGTNPTGAQPDLFCGDSMSADDWNSGENRGGGGALSLTGSGFTATG